MCSFHSKYLWESVSNRGLGSLNTQVLWDTLLHIYSYAACLKDEEGLVDRRVGIPREICIEVCSCRDTAVWCKVFSRKAEAFWDILDSWKSINQLHGSLLSLRIF